MWSSDLSTKRIRPKQNPITSTPRVNATRLIINALSSSFSRGEVVMEVIVVSGYTGFYYGIIRSHGGLIYSQFYISYTIQKDSI